MSSAQNLRDRVLHVLVGSLGVNLSAADLEGVERLDDLVPFESIALLEFVVGLEKEFGIRFAQDTLSPDLVLHLPSLERHLGELIEAAKP